VNGLNEENTVRVLTYICEEVRRQGHDLAVYGDGVERVGGMWFAWKLALEKSDQTPTLTDVLYLGEHIEQCNAGGFRERAVMIGGYFKTETGEVLTRQIEALLARWDALAPLDFYRAFEEIHPFADGNGRTGKVLLNWRNGTLTEPIFPPADFWGRRITNP
jgi:hypothetical protein